LTSFYSQFNFGVDPPPAAEDPALKTPCLAVCPTAASRGSIRDVPTEPQCPQVIEELHKSLYLLFLLASVLEKQKCFTAKFAKSSCADSRFYSCAAGDCKHMKKQDTEGMRDQNLRYLHHCTFGKSTSWSKMLSLATC
jgi:hypothetical protein